MANDLKITGNVFALGLMIQWVDQDVSKPLWQQVHDNYAHGGGWVDFEGFEVLQGNANTPYKIHYPEDPVYTEIARMTAGDEVLVAFPYAWFLWSDLSTGEVKIARLD